jgi:uncharacterized protein (DUF302 family)
MPSEGSGDGVRANRRGRDQDSMVITKVSPWSMTETVARLAAVLTARGMKTFAAIDHADEARRVGLALRETRIFIVGAPAVSTAAIAEAPLAALDLPLRVVVWEDGYQTKVSYPSPAEVARRYGLHGDLANALNTIDTVTGRVIDR